MAPGDATDPLDAWVLATAPRGVAYAASLLGDRHQAEDVVQDCYCRLLQKSDTYDLPGSGVRLLFKAITRACINLTTRRRPVLSLDAARGADGGATVEAVDTRTATPEQVLLGRELQQAVGAALARLPVPQRAALELRSLGHSQQEIAELLDISPNHAGVLVHRARLAMTALLTPFLGEAAG